MILFWLTLTLPLPTLPVANPPIIRATMHDQCVYTSGVVSKDPDAKRTVGGGRLWLQKLDLKEKSKITSLGYLEGIYGDRDALLRWQLMKGQYSCIVYSYWASENSFFSSRSGTLNRVPLSAIETVNADGQAPDLLDRRKKYAKLIEGGPDLGGAIGPAMTRGWGWSEYLGVYFDFWRPDEKQVEVYVNHDEPFGENPQRKGNRLLRRDFHPERPRRPDQDPAIQWETAGEWAYDWTGPFYVTATGDDRYFVTDTGRVFAAPRGAKAGTPLKEIWKGKPVGALIHDADAGKWYAFTPDEYFEVADPVKPKPHAVPIRRESLANDALETAAKCGRVIRGLPEPK